MGNVTNATRETELRGAYSLVIGDEVGTLTSKTVLTRLVTMCCSATDTMVLID